MSADEPPFDCPDCYGRPRGLCPNCGQISDDELEGMSDWEIEQLKKHLHESAGGTPAGRRDGSRPSNETRTERPSRPGPSSAELPDCPMCHGKGWTEWGDDDDPDAWEWCERCAGRGVAPDVGYDPQRWLNDD
jgi:hypothetical protein